LTGTNVILESDFFDVSSYTSIFPLISLFGIMKIVNSITKFYAWIKSSGTKELSDTTYNSSELIFGVLLLVFANHKTIVVLSNHFNIYVYYGTLIALMFFIVINCFIVSRIVLGEDVGYSFGTFLFSFIWMICILIDVNYRFMPVKPTFSVPIILIILIILLLIGILYGRSKAILLRSTKFDLKYYVITFLITGMFLSFVISLAFYFSRKMLKKQDMSTS